MGSALDSLLTKARKALQSGNERIAAGHYRQLLRRDRDNPVFLLEGARAFTLCGDVTSARKALKEVERIASKSEDLLIHTASGFFKLGDYHHAHSLLSGAWRQSRSPAAGIALVEVCERLSLIDDANEIIDSLGTGHPRVRLLKGILLTRTGDFEAAAATLSSLACGQIGGADRQTILRAGLLLASCLEKQERYREAWETMLGSRKKAHPDAPSTRQFESAYQKHLDVSERAFANFSAPVENINPAPKFPAPHLVTGHPRSGTSVVAIHLAKKLGLTDFDEIGGFMRVMNNRKLLTKPPSRLTPTECQRSRSEYVEQMKLFAPGTNSNTTWLDKNPGLEMLAPYWLKIFPESRIHLVRRNPLDCLVSCLFTYLPLNPFSLQFFSVEQAAASIRRSTACQDRLLDSAPHSVDLIHYEDFLREHNGEALSTEDHGPESRVLHSPNYAMAQKPLHLGSMNRYQHYAEFLPKESG